MMSTSTLLAWHEAAPVLERPEVVTWTSLTEAEAQVLRESARGRKVVEIGAAFGYSTAVMAAVAEHVWSIDPHNVYPSRSNYSFLDDMDALARYEHGTFDTLRATLMALELQSRVSICLGYSQVELAEGAELAGQLAGEISVAFIDGDHAYDAALDDLENCERLLARPAIVLVHDYGESTNPEVRMAVDDWRGQHPVRLVDTLAVIEL